jgi:7-keto-8-aminopelargonate synthetase-like enzyme
MNVLCFTLKGKDVTSDTVQSFLQRVRDDGRVFFTPTVYKGRPAIRAAISNWQTERSDVATAIEVLDKISNEIFEVQDTQA